MQDVFHYRPLTRLSFKVLTQTHRSVLDDAYGTLPAVPAEYAELTLPAEYEIHDRSICSATTGPSAGTEQESRGTTVSSQTGLYTTFSALPEFASTCSSSLRRGRATAADAFRGNAVAYFQGDVVSPVWASMAVAA